MRSTLSRITNGWTSWCCLSTYGSPHPFATPLTRFFAKYRVLDVVVSNAGLMSIGIAEGFSEAQVASSKPALIEPS